MAINWGRITAIPSSPCSARLVIAALLALVLGYFMIYGRITGVFVGIVTLSVTLTFATFLNQTAGPEWRIGRARLNGYNGMDAHPQPLDPVVRRRQDHVQGPGALLPRAGAAGALLSRPAHPGELAVRQCAGGDPRESGACRAPGIRHPALSARRLRRRQHPRRAERRALHRLGQFIVPAAMALPAAAMPIIWVAVGGRKDLTATLIGTLFVLWLFQTLIVISQQYALIVIGACCWSPSSSCPAAISSGSSRTAMRSSTGVDGGRSAPHS
jgi:branched-chain amino acid transport system permease protein